VLPLFLLLKDKQQKKQQKNRGQDALGTQGRDALAT
jgi:hypothetical protein